MKRAKTADKTPPFAMLYHTFIDERMRPMSNGAQVLYLGFLRRFNGHNAESIGFSVREAASWCKCGLSTALSLLRELQAGGLIEPVTKGSFAIKAGNQKNVATAWRLQVPVEQASASRHSWPAGLSTVEVWE